MPKSVITHHAHTACWGSPPIFHYANDAQIRELHASLHEDRHEPRCEVTVTDARGADEWANVLTPDRAD